MNLEKPEQSSFYCVACICLLMLVCGQFPAAQAQENNCAIKLLGAESYYQNLIIVDRCVVQESEHAKTGGAWHFKTLINNIAVAYQKKPEIVFDSWVDSWRKNIQGSDFKDFAKARPKTASKLATAYQDTEYHIDLIAIVNRIDLAAINESGTVTSLGEARMVYELSNNVVAQHFTFIVEYQLPARSGQSLNQELVSWAQDWKELENFSNSEQGKAGYMAALKKLTDSFMQPRNLLRIRTNEKDDEVPSLGWELRQFAVADGRIFQVALTDSPVEWMKTKSRGEPENLGNKISQLQDSLESLTNFAPGEESSEVVKIQELDKIFENEEYKKRILNGTFSFADQAETRLIEGIYTRFGSSSPNGNWLGENYSRSKFITVFNTCVGCHMEIAQQYQTGVFQHLQRESLNEDAQLSKFLRGDVDIGNSGNFDLPNCGPDSKLAWCSRKDSKPPRWNEKLMRISKLKCFSEPEKYCDEAGMVLKPE